MKKTQGPAAHSLASELRLLMRSRKARLSIDELVAKIEGEAGVGPVLFVLTLPVLLPLPPGVSMVFALPLLVVAPQIMVGRKQVWLPKTLGRQTIKRSDLFKLLHRILPVVERAETIVRPRLGFLTGSLGARMVGLACTVIALVLVLPIPFANLVPAIAMGVFSLGLTRKDGVLILAGYSLMSVAAAVVALGVHEFGLGFGYLRSMF